MNDNFISPRSHRGHRERMFLLLNNITEPCGVPRSFGTTLRVLCGSVVKLAFQA
jgi:hypothetical protein